MMIALLHKTMEAVLPDGAHVKLDRGEASVLAKLIAANGQCVERGALSMALAGRKSTESATVAVYVMRLRRKIGRDAIETVNGIGYRLAEKRVAAAEAA